MSFNFELSKIANAALDAIARIRSNGDFLETSKEAPIVADTNSASSLNRVRLKRQLILPCASKSNEEENRAILQDLGQFLARQDRWMELVELIRTSDNERAITAGGMSHAVLLAYGARADVVHAVEDAISDGVSPDMTGIEALECILTEFHCLEVALVVANAHIDIGWAWRSEVADHLVDPTNMAKFKAHFERAKEIIIVFDRKKEKSPSLAATHVSLLAVAKRPQDRVVSDYEDLIALDPNNSRAMRALGNHLLPRWFGSYEKLELEARRAAARSINTWGAGGYAWCYMDALVVDPAAANLLDVEFFIEGMRDILQRRPDQHLANQIAAYCAVTMSPKIGEFFADSVRRQLFDCFDWILTDHLRELHPLVWAQAAHEPELVTALKSANSTRDAFWHYGKDKARDSIARHFHDDLIQGTTITFSRHGLRFYPAM